MFTTSWIKSATTMIIALFFSASSFAGVIVDTVEQHQKVDWGFWNAVTYTHNLVDGLNQTGGVFIPGSALSGSLAVDIFDDSDPFYDFLPETILFTVEAFDFDTGGITFGNAGFSNELEITALGELNLDGMLDVTVSSLWGDFNLGNSVLTVNTEVTPVSVPAPTSIAVLGFALIAFGLRRKAKK